MLVTRGAARSPMALGPHVPSGCGLLPRFLKLRNSRDAGRRALAEFLLDQLDRVATEWKRWQPVIESGDLRRLLSENEANPDREMWQLASALVALQG